MHFHNTSLIQQQVWTVPSQHLLLLAFQSNFHWKKPAPGHLWCRSYLIHRCTRKCPGISPYCGEAMLISFVNLYIYHGHDLPAVHQVGPDHLTCVCWLKGRKFHACSFRSCCLLVCRITPFHSSVQQAVEPWCTNSVSLDRWNNYAVLDR